MISPYVRRLRLGMELRALRAEHNFTQARVARIIGKSRMEISRLENGQSADLADVLNILEGLGVEDERWTALEAIARDACTPGWWNSVKHIGERQALYANLEAGAERLRTTLHPPPQVGLGRDGEDKDGDCRDRPVPRQPHRPPADRAEQRQADRGRDPGPPPHAAERHRRLADRQRGAAHGEHGSVGPDHRRARA